MTGPTVAWEAAYSKSAAPWRAAEDGCYFRPIAAQSASNFGVQMSFTE